MVDENKILEGLKPFGLREDDLHESFIRSAGPGGQNVNKVSTCVSLTHVPSGITIKCQQTRSQHQNRIIARALLLKELREKQDKEIKEHRAAVEKKRRQNRKRPKALKERILENKKFRSDKKANRKPVKVVVD